MPHKSSRINTAIILLLIACVIAACGGEASQVEEPREVPTLRARANNNAALAPQTSASIPTLAPRSRPAASQPNNDNNPGEVADTAPENSAPENSMPFTIAEAPSAPNFEQAEANTDIDGSLPFNPVGNDSAGEDAPPGFAGAPAEEDPDASSPNSDLPFDTNNSSPEADSSLPFGDGSSSGGSDSGPNSDLPFDVNNNSNPFSGGSAPGNDGGGLPFGNNSGGGSPFGGGSFTSTVSVIGGRQPVSVFSCAETTCDILGQIEPGTEIEVEGNSGQWTSIRYQGSTAYVFADFVGTEQVENDGQRVADASPFGDSNSPPMDNGGGGPPFDISSPPGDDGSTNCPPFLPDCNSGPGDNNAPPGTNNPPANSQLSLPTWYTDDNQIPTQPTVTIPEGF